MKPKTSHLKLYVKPDSSKSLGELSFVWLTDDQLKHYENSGYKRLKKTERGKDYAE